LPMFKVQAGSSLPVTLIKKPWSLVTSRVKSVDRLLYPGWTPR